MKIIKIVLASVLTIAAYNVQAFGLGNAVNTLNAATAIAEKANQTTEKAKSLKKYSKTEVVKEVAVESGKGAAVGAVQGLATGAVVVQGTKGAIGGAKKGLSKF